MFTITRMVQNGQEFPFFRAENIEEVNKAIMLEKQIDAFPMVREYRVYTEENFLFYRIAAR